MKTIKVQIGFLHTRWGGGDDFPAASDATKAKYAVAHLDGDWRNVVMVDGVPVGWAGQGDDRIRVTHKDGTTTYHATRRAALRAAGL